MSHSRWPILTSYDQDHLTRIAMPLGGIGTGTVSLGGRGQLLDWEIQNHPNKGSKGAENYGLRDYGAASLFVLYAKPVGGEPVMRALEGVLEEPYEGSHGSVAGFHGVPRFRECRFDAAYPLGQVTLHDDAVPLSVRLEAFNPLIPGDDKAAVHRSKERLGQRRDIAVFSHVDSPPDQRVPILPSAADIIIELE